MTPANPMTLRLLVDGRVMQDRYHGIGRYTFELLRELTNREPGNREVELIMLYCPDAGRLDLTELIKAAATAVPSTIPVTSVRSQWLLAGAVRRHRPDVIFIPYHLSTPLRHGRVPVVTMIHDCVFERAATASATGRAFGLAYRAATRLAARSADVIAVPSRAARVDLRRFYGIEVPAGAIVPHGVGPQFFAPDGRHRPRPPGLDLPDRYILHVGAQRPHKNQRVLVQALARLTRTQKTLGLVLVGQPDPRFPDQVGQLIKALDLAKKVRRYAHLDDEALLAVYANAAVFGYPSLVEGFGMPVLEAMAAGLPVVASDAEAVRELAQQAALIVPARDPDAWARALDRVLTDPRLAGDLRRRARAVAASHTWARSAERTLSLISEAALLSGAAKKGGTDD